jgi:hypothetical protein
MEAPVGIRRPGLAAIAAVSAIGMAVLLTGCWSTPQPSAEAPGALLVIAIPVDTPSAPLQDLACRRAVFAAIDRTGIAMTLDQAGGGWEPAYALSPPGLASYDPDYRQFPDGGGRGDLPAAQADLEACGVPAGFEMTLGAGPGVESAVADVPDLIAESLARVGIRVQPVGDGVGDPLPADASLLVIGAQEPGVTAFFEPLARAGISGDLGLPAIETLLAQDLLDDPGMERERGRMIDRMILSTLRYLPIAAQSRPGSDPSGD